MDEEKMVLEPEETLNETEESKADRVKEQRRWLVELLEARDDEGHSQYRLKKPVPMPRRRDYRVKLDEPMPMAVREDNSAMELFKQKVANVKVLKNPGGVMGELGITLNRPDFLKEGFVPVLVEEREYARIGLEQEIEIQLESVPVTMPDSVKVPVVMGEDTQKKFAELKQQVGKVTETAITFSINTEDIQRRKVPKDFWLSDVEFSLGTVDSKKIGEIVEGALLDAVKPIGVTVKDLKIDLKDKLDMTIPTVKSPTVAPDENLKVNVAEIQSVSKMDVELVQVSVEIKNLVREVVGLFDGRDELMREMASSEVEMPDFTEIWELLR